MVSEKNESITILNEHEQVLCSERDYEQLLNSRLEITRIKGELRIQILCRIIEFVAIDRLISYVCKAM